MRAAVEARRKALAKIPKPKLEDYLAHCDKHYVESGRVFPARDRRRSGRKNFGRGPGLRRGHTFRNGWSCRQPGIASDLRARRRQGRAAGVLPLASALDRQCRNDRRRGLSQVLAKDFAAMDFSAEAGMVLTLSLPVNRDNSYFPAACARLALPNTSSSALASCASISISL